MIMLQTIGTRHGLNVSTTPIMAMGCWQCLPLSVVQLKVKHCRKPHCSNGVVDTFGQSQVVKATAPHRNKQLMVCEPKLGSVADLIVD